MTLSKLDMPKLDIASLPDLDTPTGVHGSRLEQKTDDPVLILMTYVYAVQHGG
ncbi:MAG: hypothetical protein P0Y56_04565 [Candidatus Andeanibacterium colombiense]|uniref:Uncharacterized protein n=1 Tax=Candidatus Andeanibacterium colombiense TaxID=3121345 RepID=A0AAJ6BNZ4_9SPHN|nr:MAG: hypothetical protein P0Y56_04565 [Sphingomonadaceae bacterium]